MQKERARDTSFGQEPPGGNFE
ncbi:hypothetical protein KL86DES1_21895 [uncultured Desulfovibrio sp.]|uniref:Uncharacterized protein n=1 Tax=uncultured Desulfovibrio sp. TaxID=167968 RepID=A0A212LA31_9BACT|nr:hypothetical protein KL86DES1_21895 [uncultured Desulfovibrio sp.]VZH34792.1 conserved protein of unknown function [Desulfovibrio sp. 86]